MQKRVKLVLRRRGGDYILEAIQGAILVEMEALRIGPFRTGDTLDEKTAKIVSQHYQVTVRA